MNKYQETFETWNKIAGLYEDKFMNLDIYDDTYDKFLSTLKQPKASILEIGCGPGNISQYLLCKNPNLKLKGIDISENMIELARKNNPSAVFDTMDCRGIENLTDTFDGIVVGFCIPYLSESDCQKLILDSMNLLNSTGILYVSFVEGDYARSGFISGSSGDRTYFYYHSLPFILDCLKANGFETVDIIKKNYTRSDSSEEMHTIIISKLH